MLSIPLLHSSIQVLTSPILDQPPDNILMFSESEPDDFELPQGQNTLPSWRGSVPTISSTCWTPDFLLSEGLLGSDLCLPSGGRFAHCFLSPADQAILEGDCKDVPRISEASPKLGPVHGAGQNPLSLWQPGLYTFWLGKWPSLW